MSLVTLKRYLDSSTAEIARMKLEAEGIPVHLPSAGFVALTGLANALGGVELQVPAASEPEARAILDQLERDLGEPSSAVKTYKGSCHCGAVTFEADLDLTQSSYRCNCSICRRTRFWPAVAKPEGFRLLSGESELTRYLFGSTKNHHYFCKVCGVRAFGVGTETPIGKMYGVNLGCLEDVTEEELSRIPITYVDGRNDRFAPPEHFCHL